MTPQSPFTIDGYVDAVPAPGTAWGTATFDLIHSPVDADQLPLDTPDTVYACSTGAPHITHLLLRDVRPGDLLRVTGTVAQPEDPDAPPHVTVDALEILDPTPAPMLLERFGDYVVIFDADHDQVPVFTASGTWVGLAANPDAIGALIAARENGGPR
ncbi:hypothetical protein [Streptomyces sp. NPDC047525]|uniref:hypothetical protein n=1 Tax=Streptomyces sp. NPDC047525 TaxID=3155264 RepID=UPI0033CF2123